jgi:hypothetical protein
MSRQTYYTDRTLKAEEERRVIFLLEEGNSQVFVAKRFGVPLRQIRDLAVERGLVRKGRPRKKESVS